MSFLINIGTDETARLQALYQYQILDTATESAFDDLTQLAAQICDVPIALISLIDAERQWFKSKIGIDVSETPRDVAFCNLVICDDATMIVHDARDDARFCKNPFVTGDPHIRFYAGAPLKTPTGYRIGTLCVIDQTPRRLRPDQVSALEALSRQVISQLELRRSLAVAQEREAQLQAIINTEPECIKLVAADGQLLAMNPAGLRAVEAETEAAVVGKSIYSLIAPEHRAQYQDFNERVCGGEDGTLEYEIIGFHGARRLMETHAVPLKLAGNSQAQLAITRDITAARQAEQALQQSTARFRTILQNMPVMFSAFDANGVLTMWNHECERITGYQANEVVGNPSAMEWFYPNAEYRHQRLEDWVRSGNSYRNWEWELTCRDGSTRIIAWSSVSDEFPIESWANWGIGVDVTEQRRAEGELRQKTEREHLMVSIANRIRQSLDLNQILNTTVSEVQQLLHADRVLTYRVAPNGTGWVTNEAVADGCDAILGQTLPPEIFPATCYDKYRKGRIQAISNVNQNGLDPCLVETMHQLKVKSKLVVPIMHKEELWGLLIAHDCHQSRQWQGWEAELLMHLATQVAIAIHQADLYQQTQIELVERRQAEQKIRDQAALLDVATDAILVQDLNRRITYWNRGAERLYGWTAAEALNQSVHPLLYCEVPAHDATIYQMVVTQGEWRGELTHWTKDEKEVVVDSRWTLIHDPEGNPQAILMVNTNITQNKELERQFLRAQRMESIGTLAGGIAHDLNNLLTPILMSIQLLETQLRDPDDPKTRQWIEIVEGSARRGANLVKQVLSFARGMEGARSPLEIKHLIWEIKKIAEETFPKSVMLAMNLPRDLWMVCGDATQLHQILMNLCINARDAMPNGGLLQVAAENVTLGAEAAQLHIDAQAGAYVTITVTDAGSGIPSEIIDRIFDPFFTTKAMGAGTGLGLSTVMSIVRSHGGFVLVSSQVGKGTEFQIYLPALPERLAPPVESQKSLKGHGELILLVDDETFIRDVTRALLEAHGYRVLVAQNGVDAMTQFSQHQAEVQLVLIDMMMPVMDGPSTIQHLRMLVPEIKVIAISGLSASHQSIDPALELNHFLMKPFEPQDLLKLLHEMLTDG
ncbi:MAG: PAS domain S-box protein [Kaiparowitsia implicata GSE-PSE-MK54-09C]|jgi:PAS domain S-box-containing protein|nr:PAS domain S-box protein [Kaiparowitsia implicata GSE-PSE-MK54-09C]